MGPDYTDFSDEELDREKRDLLDELQEIDDVFDAPFERVDWTETNRAHATLVDDLNAVNRELARRRNAA